jgi:hypothetical protein
MKRLPTLGYLLFGAGLLAACSEEDAGAKGSLTVNASGEEAALQGYPVGEGEDEIAFADGWTLQFSKVIVSLSDFSLRTNEGEDARLVAGPVVADLHRGDPELWQFDAVPARRWDRVGFRYVPATEGARKANDVDDDDLEKMVDGGYSLLVAGTAEQDEFQVEFEYGFDFTIDLDHCVSGTDETDGLVVAEGAAAEAQVTVHLDHLFFDSFAVDDAALRFEPMAAMAPSTGPVTLDDLAGQSNLSDLVDANGDPLELGYDPGPFDPAPDDLREYVIAAASTTGHFNGEGHCEYTIED